jgi:hypothetical protein
VVWIDGFTDVSFSSMVRGQPTTMSPDGNR